MELNHQSLTAASEDINCLIGKAHEMPQWALREMFRQRKKVFVDLLKWELPEYDGSDEEHDAFDTDDTDYVLVMYGDELMFSARLIDRSNSMVAKIWPDYLPHTGSGDTEISRFVSHNRHPCGLGQLAHTVFLLEAKRRGYGRFFAIANRSILGLYQRILRWIPKNIVSSDDYQNIYLAQW